MHLIPPRQEHNHVIIATKGLRNPARRDTEGGVSQKLLLQGKFKICISIKMESISCLVDICGFFFFKYLSASLMFSSCLNSKSIFVCFHFTLEKKFKCKSPLAVSA